MASTWTDEQTRKLAAASEEAKKSGIGSVEYWEYVLKKVGDEKTVKDCKEECEKNSKKTYGDRPPFTYTDEDIRKLMASIERTYGKNVNRMKSTWTVEEIRKFKAVFERGDWNLGATEFWDNMAKEVGGTKTVAHCRDLFWKGAMYATKDDMP